MTEYFSTTFALTQKINYRLAIIGLILFSFLTDGRGQSVQPDSVLGARIGFTEQDVARAIAENQELLRKYPDQDFTPLVMFQLCELYVRRSTIAHQKNMALYEAALKRYDAGELSAEPLLPRIDFTEAFTLAEDLLVKFSTASFIDKVLYRLALCHQEQGNHEMSIGYLERLVAEHPKSSYLLEGCFRLGENFFDKRQYERAIPAYFQLFNQWDNPYFDMALYKLGWSYYNLNDYPKAISTFIYLIDDINRVSAVKDAAALGKTKIDLRKEAIEYVAVCFAEHGGMSKAETFLTESLPPPAAGIGAERDYIIDIFMRLADTYSRRNDYTESTAALETILRRWPLHQDAPKLQNQIVENHLRADHPELAERERETLVKNYGPGSAWLADYFAKPDAAGIIEARLAALTLADETLLNLAADAQTRAQENNSASDYRLAIDRYAEYLEKFPNAPAAHRARYHQADCYYEIQDFAEAAEAYRQVVTNDPQSEFVVEAAYNRVLAHLEEINKITAVDSSTYQIADFLGTGVAQILRLPNKAYAKLLNACSDFSKLPIADDSASSVIQKAQRRKLPDVLMKYGETLYHLGQFELSRQVYVKVATELPPNPYSLQALSMVAHSTFQSGEYLASEKWYRKIISDFPDSARHVERAQKMIASAGFKLAENQKTAGDTTAAAQAFVALAGSSKDEEISRRSLLEAAAIYENNTDKSQARIVYEQLYSQFPNAEGAELALLKAGQLAEDLADWPRAVQNYLKLAEAFPVSPHASRAVFQAGQCYENARDTVNAVTTYRRFAQTYKADAAQLLEVMGKLGELYFYQSQVAEAKKALQETIAAYRKFVEREEAVDEYIPAQAQFLLAEIHFQDYRKVELTPPFERNFKKKKNLFNKTLAAYRDASEYQVADWATAASHKIGESFEEFARAFSEAPRPAGLSEADVAVYEESLMQKVRPFKEKALETYRANLKMAGENNVQNDWVTKSRQRIEALAAELGIATEGEPEHSSSNGTVEQSTN
jgi:TolA-binding protein